MGSLQPGCRTGAPPTGAAEWIWPATADAAPGRPAAYVLLSDFQLDAAPEAAARLFVTADREYAVNLNGHQIARGGFSRGEPIDEIQVAHLLRSGANRLAIEVRTPHGDGGALAGIELDDGSMPVVTNGSWLFIDVWAPRLVKGEAPLPEAGERPRAVRSWGRPPIGRWGPVARGELGKPDQIWRAAEARRIVRVSAAPGLPVEPGANPSFRADFGREVTGVLELELRLGDDVADRELRLCLAGNCERRTLVSVAGRPAWKDSSSRSFDTVIVQGVQSLRAARARH